MDARSTMNQLNDIFDSVEVCYLTIAKENGLSYSGMMLLLLVDSCERLTQKQVCDALFLPKSSVHSILSNLMQKGYLKLTEGGNRKEKYIVPTERGAVFVKKVVSETERIENRALSAIPEQELRAFLKTAQSLLEQMQAATAAMYQEGSDA